MKKERKIIIEKGFKIWRFKNFNYSLIFEKIFEKYMLQTFICIFQLIFL